VGAGETCDDTNIIAGDGCSDLCQQELGFVCTGSPSMCATVCNDGVVAGMEDCDDMGVVPGDGCSATCQQETGFVCDGMPSLCVEICGDSLIVGTEGCDDMNVVSTDGCNAQCATEEGWTCTGTPSLCAATMCGDGFRAGAEQCDDGNMENNDACLQGCVNNVCGDTFVNAPVEECDLGSDPVTGNSNTRACTAGNAVTGVAGCRNNVCGDGFEYAGVEECDDGNTSNTDTCVTVDPLDVTRSCLIAECGDGLVIANVEPCDDGNTVDTDACRNGCIANTCGDGVINTGVEECDDGAGNVAAGNGCRASECVVYPRRFAEVEPNNDVATANDPAGLDRITGSVVTTTGDGGVRDFDYFRIESDEVFHLTAEALNPVGGCPGDLELVLRAADGTQIVLDDDDSTQGACPLINPALDPQVRGLAPGEYYLDLRAHFATTSISNYLLTYTLQPNICGDTYRGGPEGCDDGNNMDGDGCSAMCQTVCGDAVIAGTETCEYVNNMAPQGCDPTTCQTTCGDTFVIGTEQCDDGNAVDTDGCNVACVPTEVEPNATPTSATPYATTYRFMLASIDVPGDQDHFVVTVPAGGSIAAAIVDVSGAAGTCPAGADTELGISGPGTGAAEFAYDDDDGEGACSSILASEASNLVAGTYDLWVNEFGDNASISAYALRVTVTAPVCGNGTVTRNEECDDGNLTDGDLCSSLCTLEGNYTRETEDNNARASADPLDVGTVAWLGRINAAADVDWFTFTTPPTGGPYSVRLEVENGLATGCAFDSLLTLIESGQLTSLATDDNSGRAGGCSRIAPQTHAAVASLPAATTYQVSVAHNSATAVPAGPYVLRIFATEGFCGDGLVQAAEECDDGNVVATDLCNNACAFTRVYTAEVEPNNAVGNSTVMDLVATVGGKGRLGMAGDVDVYQFTWPNAFSLRAEVSNGTGGCSFDSVLELYNSVGTLIQADNNGGNNALCSRIAPQQYTSVRNLAGGVANVYYLLVRHNTTGATPPYVLDVVARDVGCGDGLVQAMEDCDDGSNVNGDLCSSTCLYETPFTAEAEPNNAAGTATLLDLATSPGAKGSLTGATDEDFYRIVTTGPTLMRVETQDGIGGCAFDTRVEIQRADSTVLVSDDNDGIGNCGYLGAWTDSQVMDVPAGTYYVRVRSNTSTPTIDRYAVRITSAPVVCGDTFIQLSNNEECDDGNTANGDGCSASCVLENVTVVEAEPNPAATPTIVTLTNGEALVKGLIPTSTDVDYFQIVLPVASSVFAETFDGFGGCNLDTLLRLETTTGTLIGVSSDDEGIGSCSMISPFATTAFQTVAAGTYNVRVAAFSTAKPSSYVLRIRTRAVGCGDMLLAGVEQCDDGNLDNGDGCSDTCTSEFPLEAATNNTFADADAAAIAAPDQLITGNARFRGAITAGDLDTWRIQLAATTTLRLETFDRIGVDCISTATRLSIHDAAGVESKFDTTSGVGSCSTLAITLPADTYYVRVAGTSVTATVAGYVLDVRAYASAGAEVEPNETPATATPFGPNTDVVTGTHQVATDVDTFRYVVGVGSTGLRIETIEGNAETCESNGVDTTIDVIAPDGVGVVANNADSGRGACSLLEGPARSSGTTYGNVPVSAGGTPRPGTYYVVVRSTVTTAAGEFDYGLTVERR